MTRTASAATLLSGLCLCLCLSLCLCPHPARALPGEGPLPAVASVAVLSDLLARMTGEAAAVPALFAPGALPRPGAAGGEGLRRARAARLYLRSGAGLEGRSDEAIVVAAAGPLVHDLSKGVPLIGLAAGEEAERKIFAAALGAEGPGGAGAANPWFWLDPSLVAAQVDGLAEALSSLRPGESALFRERAAALRSDLLLLDGEIAGELEGLRGSPFVTFSGAWAYFARRYGLREAVVSGVAPGGGRGGGPSRRLPGASPLPAPRRSSRT